MAKKPVGEMVISLDLDPSAYTNAEKKILAGSKESTGSIDANWKKLSGKCDTYYDEMRKGYENACQKIVGNAKATTLEIERAYANLNSKLKSLNSDQYATTNAHYNTLGMKSAASINAQIDDVKRAATAQQAIVGKSSEDWIRIERAKNEQLKTLNREMVGNHDYSLAAMQRAVLRFYATMYVISTAADYLSAPFTKGFKAVEDYNQSVASLAAMVVTFSQAKEGQSLSDQWKEALSYSTAMVPILEKIAARTLLSGQETTALANAFARSGVFLQANNAAQIEGFTRISNALPLMTKGQEIMRQINTEIRSVMTGQNEQSSMMLQTLKALPGFSKENLEIWRQQGTVMENVGKLLEGFGPATALLEDQWQAVKSTLETTVTQILRGGMLATYGEIILSAKDLDKYLNENKDSLIDGMSKWMGNFLLTMYTIKAEVLRLGMLLDKLGGSMTQVMVGLFTPGAMLGNKNSIEGVDRWIKRNEELNARYKEGDKELEKLAIRYNNLEQSISKTGLAAAKLARDGEAANQKFNPKPQIDDQKAAVAAAKSLYDTKKDLAKDYYRGLQDEIKTLDRILTAQGVSEVVKFQRTQQLKEEFIEKYAIKEMELIKLRESSRSADDKKNLSSAAFISAEKKKLESDLNLKRNELRDENTVASVRTSEKDLKRYMDDETRKLEIETETRVKALEAYNKIAADNEDLALTDHQRAINRINGRVAAMQKIIDVVREIGSESLGISKAELDAQEKKIKLISDQRKLEEEVKDLQRGAAQYNNLPQYADTYYNKKMELIEKTRQLEISALVEVGAATAKAYQEQIKLIGEVWDIKHKEQNDVIKGTGKVLDATMTMYDKDSSEYKRLADLKKGIQIAEMAMEAAKNVALLSNMMAANAAYSVAMAKKAASLELTAAEAILTQGEGEPYSAWARIAAMTALVAGVLGAVGMAFGGGSSSSSSASASLPTSTVLGAANGTGSESISKSWELMQDTYDMQYTELSGIYDEMRNLNQNITGLVTSIVRTGGISAADMGEMGNSVSSVEKSLSSYIMQDLGIISSIGNFLNRPIIDIANALFGGSSESHISGYGLGVNAGSIGEITGNNGMSVNPYQWTNAVTNTSGGWFGKDSTSITGVNSAVNDQISSMVKLTYASISKNIKYLGENLGADMNDVLSYTFGNLAINILGMTSEEVTTAVNEAFSKLADDAATTLFGGIITQYQQLGEGLYETATRLVMDKEVILDTLGMTGQVYAGTTAQTIAFSESLISLAGDLDTLRTAAETYFDKFYTDTEKQAYLQNNLSEAMDNLNMSIPNAREGYRSLVNSLDLTTASGQKAYVTLMSLSESADTYYAYLEEISNSRKDMEIEIMELEGNATGALAAQRAIELAALDESLRPLQQRIYDLTDEKTATEAAATAAKELADSATTAAEKMSTAQSAIESSWISLMESNLTEAQSILKASFEAEKARLTDIYNSQLETMNANLDTAKTIVSDFTSVINNLTSAKEKMRLEDAESAKIQYSSAKIAIAAIINQARGGNFSGVKNIDAILDTLTSASTDMYATQEDYKRDFWKTYKSISELTDLTSGQLTIEETTVSILQQQIDTAKIIHNSELAAMDSQMNALLGIQTGVISVGEAINNLAVATAALAGAKSNYISPNSVYYSANVSYWGSNEAYATAIKEKLSQGTTLTDPVGAEAFIKDHPELFKTSGSYAYGGISSGPDSGYDATLHGTELIISPRANYPATVKGGDNIILIEEVRKLREEMKVANYANVKNTAKMAKVLDKIDNLGIVISETGNDGVRTILDTRTVV